MNEAVLLSAFDDGTKSWEVILFKVLALAMQSALSVRAGDITRSDDTDFLETIQWYRQTVPGKPGTAGTVLPGGSAAPLIRGKFTLRFCKGEK